jgi:hypothetical protein
MPSLLCDTEQVSFAAQEELAAGKAGGGVDAVFDAVLGEDFRPVGPGNSARQQSPTSTGPRMRSSEDTE